MTDQGQLPPYTPSREMPSYTPSLAAPPPVNAPYPHTIRPQGYYGDKPSRAMATWALVLSLLPMPLLNLVSIGLAVKVLSRGKDGRNHGKGRATTALVLAPLWLVVVGALAAAGLADRADRSPAGNVVVRGDVSVTSLAVGDCLPTGVPLNTTTLTVEVAPCSEAHAAEVYAEFALAPGPYPGENQVARLSDGGCAKRFQAFTGVGYDRSKLDVSYLYPPRATWAQDKAVTCLVSDKGPTTGTLKGARR